MSDVPIIVFDLETTGTDLEFDRAIQIAMLKYESADAAEPIDEFVTYINPDGREINPEAQAVHGISMEMLEDAPTFKDIAEDVKEFIGDCALSGYNIRAFDVPVLMNEFSFCEMPYGWIMNRPIIDARTLWLQKEPRTLTGAVKTFCGEDMVNAHDAKADVEYTFKALKAMMKKWDVSGTWEEVEKHEDPAGDHKGVIGSKSRLKKVDGKIIMLFGKHKDKDIIEVAKEDLGYLEWLLKNNFERTLKDIIRKVIKKVYPDWEERSR